MSKYKGLFTFDEDNHMYIPISQADGIIDTMDYKPAEPLIKDEKVRKAVRAWAEACGVSNYEELRVCQGHGCSFIQLQATDAQFSLIGVDYGIPYEDYCTITKLCGEEEEDEQTQIQKACD